MKKDDYVKMVNFLFPKDDPDKWNNLVRQRLINNQTRHNERIVRQMCHDNLNTLIGLDTKPKVYKIHGYK